MQCLHRLSWKFPFNRTILELKLGTIALGSGNAISFNRTILELKQIIHIRICNCYFLLIVPFWNWNNVEKIRAMVNAYLLIVPFWNWNGSKRAKMMTVTSLLIVPFWNWNLIAAASTARAMAFNRTILELKHSIHQLCFTKRSSFNRTILELKRAKRSK